jgi:hypothetical protein
MIDVKSATVFLRLKSEMNSLSAAAIKLGQAHGNVHIVKERQ